jgi:hypothetical protein
VVFDAPRQTLKELFLLIAVIKSSKEKVGRWALNRIFTLPHTNTHTDTAYQNNNCKRAKFVYPLVP